MQVRKSICTKIKRIANKKVSLVECPRKMVRLRKVSELDDLLTCGCLSLILGEFSQLVC